MAVKSASPAPSPLALLRSPGQLRKALSRARRDAEAWRLRYAEMHVAYVELLARARAEVAETRTGTPQRAGHLAGYLDEIGLLPPDGAVPDALVAEGLAVAAGLEDPR
ncbi:hypothetical protein [Actinomadura chibensis]|uniref:Uncharacterized protein n=1 Tax=Actinomadura chibensis TaxID=392828 RepID=A0A5D0N251_9ACTN|nr:hypothetical protein [Actinomadura chibensis]TYB38408.1 hypothetical protein FXF69_41455 [Actinomadura chibensis]